MNKITQDPAEQFHDEKQIPPLRKHKHLPLSSGWLLGPEKRCQLLMDTGKDAQGMAGCPESGGGSGPQGGSPLRAKSARNRCFKSAPSGWCVVCKGGRTAGEACGPGSRGPGVSNSAKRMLSGCWGGRAGG